MNKSEVLKCIGETGIVPVVRAASEDEARRLIEALLASGNVNP